MKYSAGLLVVLIGCSADLVVPPGANIICAGDNECPGGTICGPRKRCVDLKTAAEGVPGFDVTPTTLALAESGTTGTVALRLMTAPKSNVTIVLASDDLTEMTISQSVLTFTPDNWDTAQTITATGVRDCIPDGPIASHILISAESSDDDYAGMDPPDVDVTTADDLPPAGITVTPTSGLVTKETGETAQFSVVANCTPTANVHFTLSSSDTTEGKILTTEVTFTPANWSVPQVIVVSGQGDCSEDGDVAYTVVTSTADSADPLYSGLDPADVSLVNDNVSGALVSISPPSGLHTKEDHTAASFNIVLSCQPSTNVTIPLSSSDTTEGTITISGVTFTHDNWNVAQSVTVTGVDDDYDDGDIAYSIITGNISSGDVGFNGQNPIDVSLINDDNEIPAVTVTPIANPLVTTEAGGTATFTVKLSANPMAAVNITVASSNTAEGTVSTNKLVITDNAAHTVTVTGVNDNIDDDDQLYTIVLGNITSTDSKFNNMDVPDVAAKNLDDSTLR